MGVGHWLDEPRRVSWNTEDRARDKGGTAMSNQWVTMGVHRDSDVEARL